MFAVPKSGGAADADDVVEVGAGLPKLNDGCWVDVGAGDAESVGLSTGLAAGKLKAGVPAEFGFDAAGLGAPNKPGDALDCEAEMAFSVGFVKLKPDDLFAPLSCAGLFPKMFAAPVLAPKPAELGGGPAGVVEGLPKEKGLDALAAGVVEPNDGADVVAGFGVPKPPLNGEFDGCELVSSGFFPNENAELELFPPPDACPNGLADDCVFAVVPNSDFCSPAVLVFCPPPPKANPVL